MPFAVSAEKSAAVSKPILFEKRVFEDSSVGPSSRPSFGTLGSNMVGEVDLAMPGFVRHWPACVMV